MDQFIPLLLNQSPTLAVVCFMFWNMREDKQALLDMCIKNSEAMEALRSAVDKLSDRLDQRNQR